MDSNTRNTGLWVFGYGSLCWHPGFAYTSSKVGFVKGFSRRFWQGNTTHRGTRDKPGRVATLIEDKEAVVYGRAFQVQDGSALPYLEKRECALGGYMTTISTFFSRDNQENCPVVIYIATSKNEHWLGDAPLHRIAHEIFESSGPSGHNVEYLLRLAEFMHRYMPEAHDEHLFTLEMLVRSRIKEQEACLKTLMGNRDFAINLWDLEDRDDAQEIVENPANERRQNTFQYISQIPSKTLRCLKM